MTSNPKNKDTLFPPTFKIEENKVPLIFGSEVKWMVQGLSEFTRDIILRRLRVTFKSFVGYLKLLFGPIFFSLNILEYVSLELMGPSKWI